jgi:hypothetical protein
MSASSSGQFGKVLKLKHRHTLEAQTKTEKVPSAQRPKTMKPKTWKVIANTGKQSKPRIWPSHISSKEFIHWLVAESRVDDDSLRSLFKAVKPSTRIECDSTRRSAITPIQNHGLGHRPIVRPAASLMA